MMHHEGDNNNNYDDMQIDKLDLHFNMELSKIGMKQELSRKRKRNSSRPVTQ
jgi:hypothetical protein